MMEIINAVSNVGFPIVITIYLLMRHEKVIKANTDAIIELRKIIEFKK